MAEELADLHGDERFEEGPDCRIITRTYDCCTLGRDYNRLKRDLTKEELAVEISVRELEVHLSRYLRLVREREPVPITRHAKPVARLEPVMPSMGMVPSRGWPARAA